MKVQNQDKKKRNNNIITVIVMAGLFFSISFLSWFQKDKLYSESERRILKSFPKISFETVLEGKFMEEFEAYCLDQFPFRDSFRSLKAMVKYGILGQKDNNGIYLAKGHLSKMEYPIQGEMLDYASQKFNFIYETYLKQQGSKCYFAIVPDKNYVLAEESGYLSLDYEELFSYMEQKMQFAKFLDITPYISLEDYYKTDTHWRQECILDVAYFLKESMSGESKEIMSEEIILKAHEELAQYEVNVLKNPFYGVYYGQAALPVEPDTIYYLNNEALKECKVTSFDTGKPQETVIYNMEKGWGKDPYELFLSGTSALQIIENPLVKETKELIIFRDSFGSSLIPLLVKDYSKITVIDIRYVQSNQLRNFIDFHGQDTLFLYSTVILNNSLSLR